MAYCPSTHSANPGTPPEFFDPIIAWAREMGIAHRRDGQFTRDCKSQPQPLEADPSAITACLENNADPRRHIEKMLANIRSRFQQQLMEDVCYNLNRILAEYDHTRTSASTHELRTAEDCIERMRHAQKQLGQESVWIGNQREIDAWNAFNQFYCDSLFLADRLLRLRTRRSCHTPSPHLQHTRRRTLSPGAASYNLIQAISNALEQALPGITTLRQFYSLLPVLIYQALSSGIPAYPYRWANHLNMFRGVLESDVFAQLSGFSRIALRTENANILESGGEFFDCHRRTKHNVIFAMSHRHSVLDLTVLSHIFQHQPHAVWANEQFLPRTARLDPHVILVRPGKKSSMTTTLKRSKRILCGQRLPVVVFVDGGAPYLPYGQQMRVKRGIRLLVDYLKTSRQGTGRKTFIIPVSLDDTVTIVRGLDRTIRITYHAPLDIEKIGDPNHPPDPQSINYGDPLLNYLECLFLVNTGQVMYGWQTPCVLETVRRRDQRLQIAETFHGRIQRRFHASIRDLAMR